MEYKIGDKLEVATRMLTHKIPYETKEMIVTGICDAGFQKYYNFNNDNMVSYPPSRIIRKVEGIK